MDSLVPKWAVSFGLLTLAACAPGSGSGGSGDRLSLVSVNAIPGQIRFINAPLEFRFSAAIDLDSINFSTVSIVPAPPASEGQVEAGPAQGTFFLKPGMEGKTIVFQPFCPTDPEFRTGGLAPGNAFGGVFYTVTLHGADSTGEQVVRGLKGEKLDRSMSFSFETPTGYPLLDPNPFNPPKITAIENFESPLGLNLSINPNPPILITLDQPVKANSISNDSIRLEFTDPHTNQMVAVPTIVTLEENCSDLSQSRLTVLPIGILPPGLTLNLFLSKNVEGFGEGDRNVTDLFFKTVSVETPHGTPQQDALLETFDSMEGMDPSVPALVPNASWQGGLLQAAPMYPGNPSTAVEIEIGFGMENDANTSFSTDGGFLKDKDGTPVFFPNGVIEVASFTMKTPPAGKVCNFQAFGSNPLIIRCSKSFRIEKGAELHLDGQDAPEGAGIGVPNLPSPGGLGQCGGGQGGAGSPLTDRSDALGEDGAGPFNVPSGGGRGGHSGFGSGSYVNRRPGGGGGGNWGAKEIGENGNYVTICYSEPDVDGRFCIVPGCPQPLIDCASQDTDCVGFSPPPNTLGEDGAAGNINATDAVTFIPPPLGGKAGAPVFEDGNDQNDFLGRKPVGDLILNGELTTLLGGSGGGGGGDNVGDVVFPSTNFLATDSRGGGGGGGAGILLVECLGPIVVDGIVSANGGAGVRAEGPVGGGGSTSAGGGGGGAGGLVILESSTQIRLGFESEVNYFGGNRGEGGGKVPGAPTGCTATGNCRNNCAGSHGGAGSKGICELRVPFTDLSTVNCGGVTQPSIAPGALIVETNSSGSTKNVLCERDPDLAKHFSTIPHILLPTMGPRSVAFSTWRYAGFPEWIGPIQYEFVGTDSSGMVDSEFTQILASGSGGQILSDNSVLLESSALAALIATEPKVLIEDGFRPNPDSPSLAIVNASVDGNTVTLFTDPSQGVIASLETWEIHRRDFLAVVNGSPGAYPPSATARITFEGADETGPGSMIPDLSPGSYVGPTPDVSLLVGKKLLRFRVDFDMNAAQETLTPNLARPGFHFLKIRSAF